MALLLSSNYLSILIVTGALGAAAYFLDQYLSTNKKKGKREAIFSDKTATSVEESWLEVERIGAEKVGAILFKNIFEAATDALLMFSFKDEKDLYKSKAFLRHGKQVVNTVGAAVAGLRSAERLIPFLKDLGEKHIMMGKGIGKAHYDLVGEMLIVSYSNNTIKI